MVVNLTLDQRAELAEGPKLLRAVLEASFNESYRGKHLIAQRRPEGIIILPFETPNQANLYLRNLTADERIHFSSKPYYAKTIDDPIGIY